MQKNNSILLIAIVIFFLFLHNLIPQSTYNKKQYNFKSNKILPKPYIMSNTNWKKWVTGSLEAVSSAVSIWSSQVKIKNGKINGQNLSAPTNCIKAPSIYNYTYASMLGKKIPKSIAMDLAKAISQLWSEWQSNIFIPSLPLYPTFVNICGPLAPPTKNIPYRFELFTSGKFSKITNPDSIKKIMKINTGNKYISSISQRWIKELSKEFSLRFIRWIPKVLVKNLLGTGPVPNYAPPHIPCGPVQSGYVLPSPGILTAVKF